MSSWDRAGDQRACRVDLDDFGTWRGGIHAAGSVVIACLVPLGTRFVCQTPTAVTSHFDW
jgi:hypothetical protein